MHRKWLPVFIVLLAGCGMSGPEIAPVSGRVTLNGKPLAQGMVCFASPDGAAASAPLDSDGRFRMTSQYGKGIPFGTYRVTIVPRAEEGAIRMTPESKPRQSSADAVPSKYHYVHSSGLSATVDVEHREFQFDLTRPNSR